MEPRMNYNFYLTLCIQICDVVYWFEKVFSIQSMHLIQLGLEFFNAPCDMYAHNTEFRISHLTQNNTRNYLILKVKIHKACHVLCTPSHAKPFLNKKLVHKTKK